MSEPSQLDHEPITRAARAVGAARHVLALVGAGMSVESDIPPFRGPDGLWTKHGEPSMNGYMEFLRDPEAWWRDALNPSGPRAELMEALERAAPNPGHDALAGMEHRGHLQYTITQNVDDLHSRAGSRRVAEIHGNVTRLRCVQCRSRYPRDELAVHENALPPRCGECGGLIKTDAVMFGEPIPGDVATTCQEQAALCDCMLLVGTSASVFPAAGFAWDVLQRGGTLIEINPDETDISAECHVVVRDTTARALPALLAELESGDARG